jgi:hypothetical protein
MEFYDSSARLLQRIPMQGDPVRAEPHGTNVVLTLAGRILPSDELAGSVVEFQSSSGVSRPLLQGLRRPTDAKFADLDHDGRDDLVVCQFGNRLGRFSWFQARPEGGFVEHLLLEQPGAIRSELRDLDGNGLVDMVVLLAQAREGVTIFLNRGQGQFESVPILQQHPAFGYSHFELIDFDGDSDLDLLTTNGDNGDYPGQPKAYHGIRLYLNEGGLRFKEAWFYPLHGAYKVVAADFDQDGDLDLAVISFFPDLVNAPEESFIYLENRGGMNFAPFSLPECKNGRWLTMDAGDLDGDGDVDIALGCFLPGPQTMAVPDEFRSRWSTNKLGVLLLENVKRNP